MGVQPRRVQKVIEPEFVVEGAGVKLRRSSATRTLDYVDPFLLLDHFASDNPDDFVRGFPMHPHRGIETVTYMLRGFVDHKDSLGNEGRIGPGDLQWMTAGGGIMHEEIPKPGPGGMAGFQLWVNLPARLKMTKPRYQEVAAARIPEVRRTPGVLVKVIAGRVDGVAGSVSEIAADPTYLDVALPAGASFTQPMTRGDAAFAYVFEGEGEFGVSGSGGGVNACSPKLLVLGDGEVFSARAAGRATRFLLVSGKPLNEPIARYGPFVMNTRQEIEQALDDLRKGTFVW
jgi:redox-sensitive bicupin YhaK (pirin superfamily)